MGTEKSEQAAGATMSGPRRADDLTGAV